jgi:hypothetical protein
MFTELLDIELDLVAAAGSEKVVQKVDLDLEIKNSFNNIDTNGGDFNVSFNFNIDQDA